MVRAVPDTVWWDSYRNAFQISAQGLFKAVSSCAHCHCFIWLAPASHFLTKYRWFGLRSDPLTAASFVFAPYQCHNNKPKLITLQGSTTQPHHNLSLLPAVCVDRCNALPVSFFWTTWGVHVIWNKCHSLKLQSFIWKPLHLVLVSLIDLTGSECFKCNWP